MCYPIGNPGETLLIVGSHDDSFSPPASGSQPVEHWRHASGGRYTEPCSLLGGRKLDLIGGRFSGLPRIQRHRGDSFISLHCLGARSNPALKNRSWAEMDEASDFAANMPVLPGCFCIVLVKGCHEKGDLVDGSIRHTFSFSQVFKRNEHCMHLCDYFHSQDARYPKWESQGPLTPKWLLTRPA